MMVKRYRIVFLLVLVVAVGAISYVILKTKFKSPEFVSIDKITFIETIGTEAYFNAEADFYNPNNVSAQILNSELKIESRDIEIARISQSDICKVNPQSNFQVSFKFKIDLAQLSLSHGISGVLVNLLSEQKEIPVHFDGYTRVKCMNVVYKIPIEFNQKLSFK